MKKLFLLVCCFFIFQMLHAQLSLVNLLTEDKKDPLCIDAPVPHFSWQIISNQRNTLQAAYECIVMNENSIAWSSGRVASAQSVMIPYHGAALQPGQTYTW